MTPELGHLLLILALCIAFVQGVVPLLGAALRVSGWMQMAEPAARAQALCMLVSYACLTYAFIVKDFMVSPLTTHTTTWMPIAHPSQRCHALTDRDNRIDASPCEGTNALVRNASAIARS